MNLDDALMNSVRETVSVFTDPSKRVFWAYLLSAASIAVLWLTLCRNKSVSGALRKVFSRESWWTRSARADYVVFALNAVFMSVLSPRLLGQAGIAYLVFEWMHTVFGGRPQPADFLPFWMIMAGFTVTLFVLDDLSRYIVHRMLHRVPVLWAFHKVHHSATSLNPMTVFRVHPVESIIYAIRGALVQGVVIAGFVFFFGSKVQLLTVLGAGALNWMFNAFLANLRHSHIQIGFWKPVERIFISPAQHQIHHSIAEHHRDKNFGVALAVWDWIFGTLCHSTPNEHIRFGLSVIPDSRSHNLITLYLYPFSEAFRTIRHLFDHVCWNFRKSQFEKSD